MEYTYVYGAGANDSAAWIEIKSASKTIIVIICPAAGSSTVFFVLRIRHVVTGLSEEYFDWQYCEEQKNDRLFEQ